MIKFTLPITPKAQQRARHGTVGGFSRTYKSKTQKAAEEDIEYELSEHDIDEPLDGPLFLRVYCYMPIPGTFHKKYVSKAMRKDMAQGHILPTNKPDLDNLVKQIKDAMSRSAFWYDDSQVVELQARKMFDDGKGPRWEITLCEFEPFDLDIKYC